MEVHRNERLNCILDLLKEKPNLTFDLLLVAVNDFLIHKNYEPIKKRRLEDDVKYLKTEHPTHLLISEGKKGYRVESKSDAEEIDSV